MKKTIYGYIIRYKGEEENIQEIFERRENRNTEIVMRPPYCRGSTYPGQ